MGKHPNRKTESRRTERPRATRVGALMLAGAMLTGLGTSWLVYAEPIVEPDGVTYYCGYQQHVHTEECYVKELTCTTIEEETHWHDITCYDESGTLICTRTETVGHIHEESCYQDVLTCGFDEAYEHTHTLQCTSDPEADRETAEIWEATLTEVAHTGDWATDLIAVAESQLGVAESEKNFAVQPNGTSKKGISRYGQWYGVPYGDWCAMFVSWCLEYAGIPREEIPYESGCANWIKKLDALGFYHQAADYRPDVGDIIFFDWNQDGWSNHVGIVTGLTEDPDGTITVYTIEGNSSDAVNRRSYVSTSASIQGYCDLSQVFYASHPEETEPEETAYEAVLYTDESGTELLTDGTALTLYGTLPYGAYVTAWPTDQIPDGVEAVGAWNIRIYYHEGTPYEGTLPLRAELTLSEGMEQAENQVNLAAALITVEPEVEDVPEEAPVEGEQPEEAAFAQEEPSELPVEAVAEETEAPAVETLETEPAQTETVTDEAAVTLEEQAEAEPEVLVVPEAMTLLEMGIAFDIEGSGTYAWIHPDGVVNSAEELQLYIDQVQGTVMLQLGTDLTLTDNMNLVLPEGADVTLDLAGYTVTVAEYVEPEPLPEETVEGETEAELPAEEILEEAEAAIGEQLEEEPAQEPLQETETTLEGEALDTEAEAADTEIEVLPEPEGLFVIHEGAALTVTDSQAVPAVGELLSAGSGLLQRANRGATVKTEEGLQLTWYVTEADGDATFGVQTLEERSVYTLMAAGTLQTEVPVNLFHVTGGSLKITGGFYYGGETAARLLKQTGGTVTLNGGAVCGFVRNGEDATDAAGGAVLVTGGVLNLGEEVVLAANQAPAGGAIALLGGTLNLKGGTLSGNSAIVRAIEEDVELPQGGGALYLANATAWLSAGTVTDNRATLSGGAALVDEGSVLVMNGSTVIGNQAPDAGISLVKGAKATVIKPTTAAAEVQTEKSSNDQALTGQSALSGRLTAGAGLFS